MGRLGSKFQEMLLKYSSKGGYFRHGHIPVKKWFSTLLTCPNDPIGGVLKNSARLFSLSASPADKCMADRMHIVLGLRIVLYD